MKKIVIGCYMIGMVQTNFYYLHREGESATIVFDPADYGKEIYEHLTGQGLEIKAIFLTHGHFDHIMGLKALKAACGAPVYASAGRTMHRHSSRHIKPRSGRRNLREIMKKLLSHRGSGPQGSDPSQIHRNRWASA